jgi:hypothetical protein
VAFGAKGWETGVIGLTASSVIRRGAHQKALHYIDARDGVKVFAAVIFQKLKTHHRSAGVSYYVKET